MPFVPGALRIALIYLAVGSAWIVFSDWLLERAPAVSGLVGQTTKGLAFVLLSSLLIYVLLARALREAQDGADERARLERRLAATARFEAMGQLTGGIAHDFNNLLTAIKGNIDSYLRQLPAGDRPEDLVEARRSADRAGGLTRQLLAFGRRQVMRPERIDINHTIRSMAALLARLIEDRVRITTELDPDVSRVHVDPGQLEQVVMNLAINARDAMPEGGEMTLRTANVEIDAAAAASFAFPVSPGRYVRLEVTDRGVGMTPDVKAHIFEPFFTTKPKGLGTGLGLPTVYGIVKQSGGYVEAETRPGQGTTFTVLLPAAPDGQDREPAAVAGDDRDEATGTELVLVVEDDPSVRSLVIRILERRGFTVLAAPDGPEALAILRECRGAIDLLVTDANMPGMTGSQLATAARSVQPGLPILLISGYDDAQFDRTLPYLAKPFTHAQLTRMVREQLDA